MAEVTVKNLKNEVVGKISVADEVFNYSAAETLVWEAVRAFLAGRRKGTQATKNRSAVRGGSRKLWRQKGTGRARMGGASSPLWRKGGVVFGPSPRDYSQALPKKKKRGAVKVVLSDKLKNDRLVVIEDLALESHRTKDFVGVLDALQLAGNKVLIVDDRENRNLYLSTRNLSRVKMVPTLGVNVYDLLNHESLVISKRSLLELQEVLQK